MTDLHAIVKAFIDSENLPVLMHVDHIQNWQALVDYVNAAPQIAALIEDNEGLRDMLRETVDRDC